MTSTWPEGEDLMARCEICGEPFGANDERAEMYDPTEPDENSVIVHAGCGLNAGLAVA